MRKDGERFWANVILTVLRDQDGAIRASPTSRVT